MIRFAKRKPSLIESIVPVLMLIIFLIGSVFIFGDDATSGPSQVALMAAGAIAAIFAMIQGTTWQELEHSILKSIGYVTQTFLILILVGSLIGTWILGGIVPTLVVWGLKILSPEIFLSATAIISALVALATGSSWSTAGTIGIALMGIGMTMGIHPGMSAGAVISGAYFGDKMSPFSETTNLAASMVGTDLFVHIKHMLYTTVPGMIISLLLFTFIGFFLDTSGFNPQKIDKVISAINGKFDTSLYMLIPMLILFFMVSKKAPAIPALLVGSIMGIIMAILFQDNVVTKFAKSPDYSYLFASIKSGLKVSAMGYVSKTGVAEVDNLLSRGGMLSMLPTIWLIMSAMFFSGIMEGSGMLQRIAVAILSVVKGTGNLIFATIGTTFFMNFTTSDQYMSIVISGRMYQAAYKKEGLHPKNLSRVLEDGGTLTSPLIPWNTCGAFMAATLGVATITYLPFAFLNLINPIISIFYGYTGITITPLDKDDQQIVDHQDDSDLL